MWSMSGRVTDTVPFLIGFAKILERDGEPVRDLELAAADFSEEEAALKKIIKRTKNIIKNPQIDERIMYDTYGVSPEIVGLVGGKVRILK